MSKPALWSMRLLRRCDEMLVLCALSLGLVAACGTAPTQPAPRAVPPAPSIAAPVPTIGERCAQLDWWQCEIEPSDGSPDALCNQLRTCMVGQEEPGAVARTVELIGDCSVSDRTALPAGSGIDAVSVLRMEGVAAEMNGLGAYLVVEREGAFCVVDTLARFLYGFDRFENHVELAVDRSGRIRTTTQRERHITLDAEELDSGESEVDWQDCTRADYVVARGVIERQARTETEGACHPAEDAE